MYMYVNKRRGLAECRNEREREREWKLHVSYKERYYSFQYAAVTDIVCYCPHHFYCLKLRTSKLANKNKINE